MSAEGRAGRQPSSRTIRAATTTLPIRSGTQDGSWPVRSRIAARGSFAKREASSGTNGVGAETAYTDPEGARSVANATGAAARRSSHSRLDRAYGSSASGGTNSSRKRAGVPGDESRQTLVLLARITRVTSSSAETASRASNGTTFASRYVASSASGGATSGCSAASWTTISHPRSARRMAARSVSSSPSRRSMAIRPLRRALPSGEAAPHWPVARWSRRRRDRRNAR